MINLKAFIGSPTNFNDICFIYPPKIKDIINNDKYNIYQKMLTISQEEIYDQFNAPPIDDTPQFTVSLEVDPTAGPKPIKSSSKVKVPTPLEYLLSNCNKSIEFYDLLNEAFQLFTHCDILPLYEEKAFYVGNLEAIANYTETSQIPLLNDSNFLDFQNAIRQVLGFKIIEKPDPNEDPRITRMKAKARYRDKIKAETGMSLNFDSMLVAICCMGIGITPLNIGEMSYGAAQALFSVYQNKEKYELDTSSLLAGADPKHVKPKYWINNLNE